MDDKAVRNAEHEWHVQINRASDSIGYDKMRWMYSAKHLAEEARRLPRLFKAEREGTLRKVHHQCSYDKEGKSVPDNHLTCCLGVECRNCEFLRAIETPAIEPEMLDQIKAWTCIAHILHQNGASGDHVDMSEGMILTTDDRMFWDNVYESMAASDEEPEE